MEQSFGDAGWDILLSHKGEWCLYKSQLCQEGICIGCQIYKEADKKWQELLEEIKWAS